jgi:hypothetical protein
MGLFGSSENSASTSVSDGIAAINSSGWAVGRSSATGGGLSTQSGGLGLPWYAWVSLGIVGLVVIRKMKGK